MIPETVTAIGEKAFYSCKALSAIEIPQAVTTIGQETFESCTSLTAIVIPDSVTKIGMEAFYACTALESVTLPDGLKDFGKSVFSNCKALTSITLPSAMTEIPASMFNSCTKLESIEIPDGVTVIGSSAFPNCDSLNAVRIPGSVTSIGSSAFNHCDALEEIALPENLKTISGSAFYYSDLKNIVIPDGVETLGETAFYGCDALESAVLPGSLVNLGDKIFSSCDFLSQVTLGNGLTKITAHMFSDCISLAEITIPDTVTSIGSYAFEDCTSLLEITIPDAVTSISSYTFNRCSALTTVNLPETLTEIGSNAFADCYALTELKIPDSVTILGKYAFSHCDGLTHVVVPASVTNLPDYIFYYCVNLQSVTLEDGLRSIGNYAFDHCEALTEITLPDSVISIGNSTFNYCSTLTGITIPQNVATIGNSAFSYCSALSSVTLPSELTKLETSMFRGCTSLRTIELPAGLTRIGDTAFSGCASLMSIEIPQGVTSIEKYTFNNCDSLVSVTLPDSVTTIGDSAFRDSDALQGIILPASLNTIGVNVFYHCDALKSVTIPNSVTSIGYSAFMHCKELESVVLSDSMTEIALDFFRGCTALQTITIPNSVTKIGETAFCDCTSLASIILPDSLTFIGNRAFENCESLSSITIPNGVTLIGSAAFYGCKLLKSIVMPDTVATFGTDAFRDCKSLVSITLPDTLTKIEASLFRGCANLRAITIPKSVRTVGEMAFAGCKALTTMVLPSGVTSIGQSAFSGCSGLTSISIPDTVTSISAYAFSEPYPRMIVYPESYAETYAINKGFAYSYFFDLRIGLTVLDSDGTELKEGFTVTWYDDAGNELFKGMTLYGITAGKTYFYEIVLGDEIKEQYMPLKRQAVALADLEASAEGQYSVSCTLQKLESVTISGSVKTENGEVLPDAELIFLQTVGEETREVTAKADADGCYEALIVMCPTSVTVTAKGFCDQKRIVISEDAEVNDQTDFRMVALPQNKITLSVTQILAGTDGENSERTITSAKNFRFTVFNKTRNQKITDFTLQFPYIYLSPDSAAGGDVLRIDVSDRAGNFNDASAEVALDEYCSADVSVRLIQKGYIGIKWISGVEKTILMLFDAAGNLISSENVRTAYTSPCMTAGTYTMVLLAQTNLLRSVAKLSALDDFGLVAGTDYVKKTISVSDGMITEISDVTVPALNEDTFSYINTDGTSFVANHSSIAVGQFVTMRLEYEVNESASNALSKVIFHLPEGITFVDGSLSVNGKIAQYSKTDNQIAVSTNANKGIIRFYILPTTVQEALLQSFLEFQINGSIIRQPAGSATVAVSDAQLELANKTGRKTNTISGTAIAGSEITVYDNDVAVGTVTTNKAGNWHLTFDLVDVGTYSYHNIYAIISNDYYGGDIQTESLTLLYDDAFIDVIKLEMYVDGSRIAADFTNPYAKIHSYSITRSADKVDYSLSFDVAFADNSKTELSAVSVVTKSVSDTIYVPLKYDAKKNSWVGARTYTTAQLPTSVGIVYKHEIEEYPESLHEMIDNTSANNIQITATEMDGSTFTGCITNDGINLPLYMKVSDAKRSDYTLSDYEQEGYSALVDTQAQVVLFNAAQNSMIQILFAANGKSLFVRYDVAEIMGAEQQMYRLLRRSVPNLNNMSVRDVVVLGQKVYQENGHNDPNAIMIGQAAERLSHLDVCKKAAGFLGIASAVPIPNNAQGSAAKVLSQLYSTGSSVSTINDAANAMVSLTEAQAAQYRLLVRLLKESGYITTESAEIDGSDTATQVNNNEAKLDVELDVIQIIDPSGYVYEAVPSNRLEGVRTEVYYVDAVLDDFGNDTGETQEVLWNAEDYDQINPQYTDADGRYQWDVPMGQWLVKYSKEGYYDTDSRNDPAANEAGYLPVPPPQVDVNTAMVSKAAPEVESVNVYNDEVQIIFTQYMDLSSVNTTNVTVKAGGKTVSGTIEPVNAEYNYEGTVQYASIFRFRPKTELSGQTTVSICNTINYAGAKQLEQYAQTKTVVVKPQSIVTDTLILEYGSEKSFDVQILPAEAGAGKQISVDVVSPGIANTNDLTITADARGKAVFAMEGLLPGCTDIEFSLEGTNVKLVKQAQVTLEEVPVETCATVQSNLASGAYVKAGTQITLHCDTIGASIYYTTDDSDPSAETNTSRTLYSEPIVIQKDVVIKAYAVKTGMHDSAVENFAYTICTHTYENGICKYCGAIEPIKNVVPKITVSNAVSSGKPKLTWEAVAGAVKYEIWRSTKQNTGFTKIFTQKGTTYTNTSAKTGTKYYYKIKAVDADGNVSKFSNRVSRTCDLAQPNVTATNVASSGKIKLSWKKIDGAVKYQIYRSKTGKDGSYSRIATVTGTTYTNTSVTAGTKYYYKVKAIHRNTEANSAFSTADNRIADLAQPTITVKLNASGKPRISWKKVTGAVKYEVYRATSKNGTYTPIATTKNLYQVDKNAKMGKTYYYKVKAVHSNATANSVFSTVKSVKSK